VVASWSHRASHICFAIGTLPLCDGLIRIQSQSVQVPVPVGPTGKPTD
jgi:hypothetical protein